MTTGECFARALWSVPRFTLDDALWYGLMAGSAWLFFHVTFRERLQHRRISARPVAERQVSREILQSLRSLAIFGWVGGAVRFASLSGWTQIYRNFDDYGWTWYVVSVALMILMHDAYFYWTHRLMHHRRLFKLFHRTHHLSTSPTPWAAYAFSPLEAFVQAGIAPLIAFTIPVHPTAFVPFMIWQITFNVVGHCGYEIYPRWFLRTPIGKVLTTPTHHSHHHEKFLGNFSLYFVHWDKLFGTEHADYEARFARATGGGGPTILPLTTSVAAVAASSPGEGTITPRAMAS